MTDGFPSQKASNAASVGPMLVQRWHTTIGITLCQRWPNVSVPTLGRCWRATVGPTLGQLTNPRWANVGEPTLAQRKGWRWANVAMLAGYLSPHCYKCSSFGCIAAIRCGNTCHGPHSDSVYSGSKHRQFNLPRLVKRKTGFPNARQALIGSNQLWRVNDSPYYRELFCKVWSFYF